MKTLKYVKQILLVGTLGVAISGCVKSNDPDFQISGLKAYVIQKNAGSEPVSKQFGTYVAMGASYGDVESASVTKDGMPLMYFAELSENVFETRRLEWNSSLDRTNGKYVVSTQDDKGQVAQMNFTLDIDKSLGTMKLTEPLKYESGQITAKWGEVENATVYAIMVGIGVKDASGAIKFYRLNSGYYYWNSTVDKTSGRFNPSYDIPNTPLSTGTELIVAVVAANQTQTGGLYLEGDYYRIVVGQDGVTPVTGFN